MESKCGTNSDTSSAFFKAEKMLMERYHLYWTPCVAHYIDLIFEDIKKKERVTSVIKQARMITNYSYNHNWLLTKMRETYK